MRRLACALLAALALALVARPLLHREVFTFRDHTDYFQPLRWYTATSLEAGHLPLWNPYNASGEPWLANPQTGVFYPPAWLFVVVPFEAATMLYLALHLALLGCGALLLFGRSHSPGAALIGATALMLCGPALSLLDVQNNLATFAWIPLVLWCAVTRANAMGSAAAIAMSFLAGEPLFAAAGAILFAIVRRRDVLDVGAQSFALAGVQLVPFLALLRGSNRLGGEPDPREVMPLSDWLRVAAPPSLESTGFDANLHQHFVPLVYVGVIVSALALLGAVFAWRRAGPWLALLAASMLLALLPVAFYRYPARFVVFGALAIVALAVEGWDVVARWIPMRSAAILVAVAIAAELLAAAKPLLVTAPMPWQRPVPYDGSVGRAAKIVRLGDPALVALNRRAWISGYRNLYERRFDAWTAAPVVSSRYADLYERAMRDRTLSLFSAMSVGYLLAPRGSGVALYLNPKARPLAFPPASVLAFGASFIHATISLPSASTMTVTQQSAEGWSVDVDGHPAPLERGDFLAVKLAAGTHDVMFRYRSTPLVIGALLTSLALARMLLPKPFVKRWSARKNFFRGALK